MEKLQGKSTGSFSAIIIFTLIGFDSLVSLVTLSDVTFRADAELSAVAADLSKELFM